MQKKCILTIGIFIIGIFISITSVRASTKVAFKEVSNGNINTTLHFEDGFVGGIDITLKVNNDVTVKKFNFDNTISKSNFTADYKYNKNNNTLTIKVTSGGIGTNHNLLNEKKELSLGNILFETSSKKDIDYTVECIKLTTLDNTWKSQVIIPSDDNKTSYKQEFIYKVVSEKDNNKSTQSNSYNDNKNSNNTSTSNNANNKNTTNSNNNSHDSTNDGNITSDKEDSIDTSQDIANNNITNDNDESDEYNSTDKQKNKKDNNIQDKHDKKSRLFLRITGLVITVSIVGILFAITKHKRI